MTTSFINDPKHWRDRAEEARTLAEMMNDEASKQMMLRIAADFDRLAEHATLRTGIGEAPTESRDETIVRLHKKLGRDPTVREMADAREEIVRRTHAMLPTGIFREEEAEEVHRERKGDSDITSPASRKPLEREDLA
jgi:hypothetical protein